jgi:hypothetical protein
MSLQDLKGLLPLLVLIAAAVGVMTLSGTDTYFPSPTASSTPTPLPAAPLLATSSSATTTKTTKTAVPEDPAAVSKRNLTLAGGNLLRATVNIYCTSKTGGTLRGASGSGVIVDSRGLILTAAHIAQYFLLVDHPKKGSTDCVIRTGGPATKAYTAALVYLSPSWLEANPKTLIETAPKGTGEDDFAFLAITGSATSAELPASFPFVPLGTQASKVGEKVAIGGYAAQYLKSSAIQSGLYPTIVFDTVTDRYTFDTDTVDVLSVNGTAAAQEGASGGGIANEHNQIVGVITTSSVKGNISDHILHAITPRHIRASFMKDSGTGLDAYLAGNDLKTLVSNFSAEFAELKQILVKAIAK